MKKVNVAMLLVLAAVALLFGVQYELGNDQASTKTTPASQAEIAPTEPSYIIERMEVYTVTIPGENGQPKDVQLMSYTLRVRQGVNEITLPSGKVVSVPVLPDPLPTPIFK
ncbi:MAG: hypothetical protein M1150_04020 [Patescibacteria group bacterium]|nr:hypothetical protein [Patescibacteria group bacterium]